jgi:hypothetical protein
MVILKKSAYIFLVVTMWVGGFLVGLGEHDNIMKLFRM